MWLLSVPVPSRGGGCRRGASAGGGAYKYGWLGRELVLLLLTTSLGLVQGFVLRAVPLRPRLCRHPTGHDCVWRRPCTTTRTSTTRTSTTRTSAFVVHLSSSSSPSSSSDERTTTPNTTNNTTNNNNTTTTTTTASSLVDLQALFAHYCNANGLMTKNTLQQVPILADLMMVQSSEDVWLSYEEFTDIWNAAPKVLSSTTNDDDDDDDERRITVDSFVQICRAVDDLFEEESDDNESSSSSNDDDDTTSSSSEEQVAQDEELESVFYKTLCSSQNNVDDTKQRMVVLSKQTLREWSEIDKLVKEGLLGQEEFDKLWRQTPKASSSKEEDVAEEVLDLDGFLRFNEALDELFVFEDDDDDDAQEGKNGANDVGKDDSAATAIADTMVIGEDLPPGVLFAALANQDYLVGQNELGRWGELQQMLQDGDLLPLEFQNILEDVPKAEGTNDMLDEAGFTLLWEAIDALFEEEDNEDDDADMNKPASAPAPPNEAKRVLLSLLDELNSDDERLPCGLESTERECQQVKQIVSALEESPSNVIQQTQGNIAVADLAGDWELLYSSSSAMKFNKGLSGLGGSVPNGKFGGLVQKLQATKYMTDVEYVERIDVNPSSASFDVRVTGDWDLRTSVSLFTGSPSTVMTVEPNKVTYGPTSTKADHWKSLGPLNMLDVTYLDNDLRVMRGNTATDAIFVFQRSTS